MGMYVISDNEQEKSVIADDETGRCYGYITSGPGHRELLLAFLEGLQTHVAAYEPHELSSLWEGFTDTVNQLNESLRETVAEGEGNTGEGDKPESDNAGEVVPDNGGGSPSEPIAEPEVTPETPEDPTTQSSESSEELTASDGNSQTPATMPCFNCGGSGNAPVTGGKCGVCDGTGEIANTPTHAVTE